jgi:hypothetical protein
MDQFLNSYKCLQFKKINNATSFYSLLHLNLFIGILDGRFTMQELEKRVPNDEAWDAVRRELSEVGMLIIDEASMLSRKIFEQVSI